MSTRALEHRRYKPSELSTTRLLEAAADLIAERGYTAASLAAIGQRAGYSHGLVNARFGSKEGLLVALLDRMTGNWDLEQLDPNPADNPGIGVVRETLSAITDSVVTHPVQLRAFYALMFEAFHVEPLRGPTLAIHERLHAQIAGGLRHAIEDGSADPAIDPELEARLIVAGLRGAAYQWLMDAKYPFEAVMQALATATEQRVTNPGR